jgi:hypothetical protein
VGIHRRFIARCYLKAITGGDELHAEYKYRESFEFNPYCRLVFSANHVPRSGDASHVFYPLSVWLANNTVSGASTWVAKSELIAAFNKAAEDAGRAGFTSQAFGRAMKRVRPEVGEAQRTVGGRQVKCYTGIGLKGGDGSWKR